IRPEGNSYSQWSIARRTRSRLSRTATSASPTTVNCGRPGPQWTSTRTSGASSPNCARERTQARLIARRRRAGGSAGLPAPLERRDALFELLEPLAASPQHALLDVEFLPRHEIEPGEPALQHGPEVLLEGVLERGEPGRHGRRELARKIVERFRIEGHREAPLPRDHARAHRPCAMTVQRGVSPAASG